MKFKAISFLSLLVIVSHLVAHDSIEKFDATRDTQFVQALIKEETQNGNFEVEDLAPDFTCQSFEIPVAQEALNLLPEEMRYSIPLEYLKLKAEDQTVWMYVLNNEPVGFVRSWIINNVGFIYQIAVDKKHRLNGFGAKLLDHAVKYLNKKNIAEIMLETRKKDDSLKKFYESVGFSKSNIMLDGKPLESDIVGDIYSLQPQKN